MPNKTFPQPESAKFADHIEAHEEQIFLRWQGRVMADDSSGPASALILDELRNHLPEILAEFCLVLRSGLDSEELSQIRDDAESHGRKRWLQGYSLKGVLEEIDHFREILLWDALDDFVEQDGGVDVATRLQIEHLGYEFFKETSIDSVIEFSECHHAILREQREELDEANEELNNAIKRLRAEKARVRELSLKDPLTGVANRRHLKLRLGRDIHRADRYDEPLTVVMMDLDHFKPINDTWGHDVGDRVLKAIAKVLRKYLRTPDFIARYGGEEFSLVLPETSLEQAGLLVKRIMATMAELLVEPLEKPVTASFGIAQRREGEDARKVLARADEAMYEAKNNGRNCMVLARD